MGEFVPVKAVYREGTSETDGAGGDPERLGSGEYPGRTDETDGAHECDGCRTRRGGSSDERGEQDAEEPEFNEYEFDGTDIA